MRRLTSWFLAFAGGILLYSAGCTLKGTTQEITDTTSNVTVSTSGRIWWNEDGLLNPQHKAIAFMTYNEANLEQDMARGQGEYLTSLGLLLGTTSETHPLFQARVQGDFLSWMPADHVARLQQIR
jgi:hypothetical protein